MGSPVLFVASNRPEPTSAFQTAREASEGLFGEVGRVDGARMMNLLVSYKQLASKSKIVPALLVSATL